MAIAQHSIIGLLLCNPLHLLLSSRLFLSSSYLTSNSTSPSSSYLLLSALSPLAIYHFSLLQIMPTMPPYRTQLKIINWIHAIQVVLAVGGELFLALCGECNPRADTRLLLLLRLLPLPPAMAVCGYRMLTKSIRSTRSDIMALGAVSTEGNILMGPR